MSASHQRFNYDISKITAFNPAIIYGFEVEESSRGLTAEEQPLHYLLHEIGQREDIFNAYLFAQEIILKKEIAEKGVGNITPQDILRWLNELHTRSARALAKDAGAPEEAGQYASSQILRWRKSGNIQQLLQKQFAYEQGLRHPQLEGKVGENFVKSIQDEDEDPELAKQFVAMMHKYFKLDIPSSTSQQAYLKKNREHWLKIGLLAGHNPVIALSKVESAYHLNLLSAEEKRVFDKLAKVCHPPEDMPALMNDFAVTLAAAWNKCDKTNLKEVAEVCRMAFFGITDIHPYFNRNGSTATCFANIISVSLTNLSFLMRNPGERNDKSSNYALVIERIDNNPGLLREHILSRLHDAEQGKSFCDDDLKELIDLRFEFIRQCFVFRSEFPKEDINAIYFEVKNNIHELLIEKSIEDGITPQELKALYDNTNKISVLACKIMLTKLSEHLVDLREKAQPPVAASSVVLRTYSPNEKQAIIDKLQSLAGLSGWKAYQTKDGLQILVDMDTLKAPNN